MTLLRRHGYLPDRPKVPGERPDWGFDQLKAFRELKTTPGPTDLRHLVVDVLDQGALGSCVANAGFQALRMTHRRAGIPAPLLGSRLLGYLVARAYIDTTAIDSGSHIRDFFRGLNKYGFLPETEYPYDVARFADRPNEAIMRRAYDQKDKGDTQYVRISSSGAEKVGDICQALDNGYPVVFGFQVPRAFAEYDRGFCVWDAPASSDEIVGGHALCLVGHGIAGRPDSVTAVGSWGPRAHDDGYHHFTFDFAERFQDVWVVSKAPYYSEVKR